MTPKIQGAQLGESKIFTCISDEIVYWKFKGPLLNNMVSYRIGTSSVYKLKIVNVSMDNQGLYSCYGKLNGLSFVNQGYIAISSKFTIIHASLF